MLLFLKNWWKKLYLSDCLKNDGLLRSCVHIPDGYITPNTQLKQNLKVSYSRLDCPISQFQHNNNDNLDPASQQILPGTNWQKFKLTTGFIGIKISSTCPENILMAETTCYDQEICYYYNSLCSIGPKTWAGEVILSVGMAYNIRSENDSRMTWRGYWTVIKDLSLFMASAEFPVSLSLISSWNPSPYFVLRWEEEPRHLMNIAQALISMSDRNVCVWVSNRI